MEPYELEKKSATITIKTTDKIKDGITKLARERERTVSWIVGKLIEQYIEKETKKSN